MKIEVEPGALMKKKYWFYIDTCCVKKVVRDSLLIYNSLNGRIMESRMTPEIEKIMRRLKLARNLGVISLDDNDLKDTALFRFIEGIRREFMGDLIAAGLSDGKPVQLVPREMIRDGVEYWINPRKFKVSTEKVMEYLSRIAVVLTDHCSHGCSICSGAHEQFLWCSSRNGQSRELEWGKLASLLEQLAGRNWTAIDILGGDIFNYSRLNELFSELRNTSVKKNLVVHYLQAFDRLPMITDQVSDTFSCSVLVHFPTEMAKMEKVAAILQAADSRVVFHFSIESEDDFALAEKISQSCSLRQTEYHPFFNGKNLEMFRQNVYIDKNDIAAAKPSRKKIFANQVVNAVNFGKLIVLPDGKVKANIHDPVLGEIGKNSLQEIVFKELSRGKSWRKIRRRVKPCQDCFYVNLCPPLSNYNMAIGKNDLCHIDLI